jgi:hypothetical protein
MLFEYGHRISYARADWREIYSDGNQSVGNSALLYALKKRKGE